MGLVVKQDLNGQTTNKPKNDLYLEKSWRNLLFCLSSTQPPPPIYLFLNRGEFLMLIYFMLG